MGRMKRVMEKTKMFAQKQHPCCLQQAKNISVTTVKRVTRFLPVMSSRSCHRRKGQTSFPRKSSVTGVFHRSIRSIRLKHADQACAKSATSLTTLSFIGEVRLRANKEISKKQNLQHHRHLCSCRNPPHLHWRIGVHQC